MLCWLRYAVRANDNPVLDTAGWIAANQNLPLVILFELCPRDPEANIRAWRFALQGALDLRRDLIDQGWPAPVIHVQCPSEPGSVMNSLAKRCSIIVTDASPTPASRRSVDALARSSGVSILEVDATSPSLDSYNQPTEPDWPSPPRPRPAFENNEHAATILGLTPLPPRDDAIEAALHEADIHLALRPLNGVRGGRVAGEKVLADLLNTSTPYPPTSQTPTASLMRLSPYLAHGHLSPWKVLLQAHIAAQRGHSLAAQVVQHVGIDRPMGFAAMRDAVAKGRITSALPPRVRSIASEQHSLPSFESLSRAHTDDQDWNRIQYEFMTSGQHDPRNLPLWSARVIDWTGSPEKAIDTLLELARANALDAEDPWFLYTLLQAMSADVPVSVPSLNSGVESTENIPTHPRQRIAVIGAGIAGLVAARALADLRFSVDVFDRGRRPGGRATTRRLEVDGGEILIDQGCQYLTPIDHRFARTVGSWYADGILAPWQSSLAVREALSSTVSPVGPGATRFVGASGMGDLPQHLAQSAPDLMRLHLSTTIARAQHDRGQWYLVDEQGTAHAPYDALIIATPPDQAARLFESPPEIVQRALRVRMAPCWAGLLALRTPVESRFDAVYAHGTPVLYASRESTKPGRNTPVGIAESWVVHMAEDWSAEHIEKNTDEVLPLILAAFASAVEQPTLDVAFAMAHRWKFARCKAPLDQPCLFDTSLGLSLCGDWCLGTRAESAYLSALAATGRVLEWLDRS